MTYWRCDITGAIFQKIVLLLTVQFFIKTYLQWFQIPDECNSLVTIYMHISTCIEYYMFQIAYHFTAITFTFGYAEPHKFTIW